MLVVPVVIPVTMPEDNPIVATDVVPLVQVPPPGLVCVILAPTHKADGPLMADGNGLTVTDPVRGHPAPTV